MRQEGKEAAETRGESGLLHLKSFISTLGAPVAERSVLSDTSLAPLIARRGSSAPSSERPASGSAVRCLVLGVLGARRRRTRAGDGQVEEVAAPSWRFDQLQIQQEGKKAAEK